MTPEELELHKAGMKYKFIYSMFGLVVGILCIAAGTFLGLSGVVGHTSWTASMLGFSTNINDAAPGVIVFIVGIFFVLITRFKVKHIVENPVVQVAAASKHETASREETTKADKTVPAAETVDSGRYGGTTAPGYSSGGRSELIYTTNTTIPR
jgi:cytochrome b subunit of formate dehydrogenase